MATIKLKNISLAEISKHKYLRDDCKYWKTVNEIKYNNFIELGDLFDIINGISCSDEYTSIKTSKPYIRIGDLSIAGDITRENIIYLNEDYEIPEKKVLKEGDIVLAAIGATVGKTGIVNNCSGGTASNNTVILRIKEEMKSEHNPYFYRHLLQTNEIKKYIFGVVSQKAQPNLQEYDLIHIRLPNIKISKQNYFLQLIKPIETDIYNLENEINSIPSIIDNIIAKEFRIDIVMAKEMEKNKVIDIQFSKLSENSSNIRFSFRCTRAIELQKILLKDCKDVINFGKCIVSTQNGWSPSCNDDDTKNAVLGIDCFNKDTTLQFDNLKYSDIDRPNMERYYIKDDDFFVSRGNTPDLVALASIAELQEEFENVIYSDLMIKINTNERINKKYAAYIFNSVIGRLYFKYISKGKNQSMVKISGLELNNLLLPVPDIENQKRIIENIKVEIDKQALLKLQIFNKSREIEKMLMETYIGTID